MKDRYDLRYNKTMKIEFDTEKKEYVVRLSAHEARILVREVEFHTDGVALDVTDELVDRLRTALVERKEILT